MCIDFNNRFRRWQTQFKYLAVCGSVTHLTVVSFSMSSQTLIVSISDILHWQMYVNSLNDHFMLMSCNVMTVFTRHNTIMELDILKLMETISNILRKPTNTLLILYQKKLAIRFTKKLYDPTLDDCGYFGFNLLYWMIC